jgi:HSP20 family protein
MANITRTNPFEDLFFKVFPAESDLKVKIDVKEDDRVSLRAETKQEKEEKKGEKVVYSERSYGMVSRSFTLPADVDAKGAKAEYQDGVLSLTLPKKDNGSAKRIAVS